MYTYKNFSILLWMATLTISLYGEIFMIVNMGGWNATTKNLFGNTTNNVKIPYKNKVFPKLSGLLLLYCL